MQDFTWAPVRRDSQRFASPRFTELSYQSPAASLLAPGATAPGESPLITTPQPFDRAVLSWNGEGRWRLEMRLQINNVFTPYFLLGVLDGANQRSAMKTETAPPDPTLPVSLDLDTLAVKGSAKATAFQVRATGEGNLRSLAVTHYRRDERRYTDQPVLRDAWGTILPVPERAQRDVEDPAIGGIVCSPTSLSMVLEYLGSRYRTIEVARAAFDPQGKLYGNWPCNTGAAARLIKGGGWSAVVKMTGFDELESEIAARRPVVISHRWERGDLTNAPISHSNGHLIVAVGFTKEGDVVVNDPAAKAGEVRRIYKRRELFRTWQERGEGIAYLIQRA
jgi:hypothetical protein